MTADARFEDGGERPLRLRARDPDDLAVISSFVQDAVFPITEMKWIRSGRCFAVLLNRFRWEDADRATRAGRPVERVRTVLAVEDVQSVASQGLDRSDKDVVLSLLSVGFEPGPDGTGLLRLVLAGDGVIRIAVEALEVTLVDVTKPYAAPSRRIPQHPQ